jgi:poly(A) polymerase
LRRLAALVDVDAAGAVAIAERLRFSNAWRDRLHGLAPPWAIDPRAEIAAQRRPLYRVGAERYRDIVLRLAAERAISPDRLVEVGPLLDAVREWWEARDFTADRAACLARLEELVAAGIWLPRRCRRLAPALGIKRAAGGVS